MALEYEKLTANDSTKISDTILDSPDILSINYRHLKHGFKNSQKL